MIAMMTKEDVEVLAGHLDEILDRGLEVDVLEWLARNRRAKSLTGFSDTPPADEEVARILEEAAQKSNDLRSGFEVSEYEAIAANELTDQEVATVLNRQLPVILDDGFEEPEIVKALALWRLVAINDEKRPEEKKLFDKKAYEIWPATAARLDALLEETANDLDFDDLEEAEPLVVVAAPALRILDKKPDLFHKGVDFTKLVNRLNQTGRNELCPCESGKKFKKCCGSNV